MYHHLVVGTANLVLELGAIRAGRFEIAAADHHVNGTVLHDHGLALHGLPPLVRVDMAGLDDVEAVPLVQLRELPRAEVATGALVLLPEVAGVVFVG